MASIHFYSKTRSPEKAVSKPALKRSASAAVSSAIQSQTKKPRFNSSSSKLRAESLEEDEDSPVSDVSDATKTKMIKKYLQEEHDIEPIAGGKVKNAYDDLQRFFILKKAWRKLDEIKWIVGDTGQ
jgi:hypothetical protein